MKNRNAFALALGVAAVSASAQDMEPRAYSKMPVGMNFVVAAYTYSEGGVATDPSIPLEDAEFTVYGSILVYVRSFGLLGKSRKADVILPYAWVSGDALFAGQPASARSRVSPIHASVSP